MNSGRPVPRLTGLAGMVALGVLVLVSSCSTPKNQVLVSVKDQKMALLDEQGRPVATYPISTSKFGLGDERNSGRTPIGTMEIARKIGDNAPIGAVFKSRRFTGEVIPVDAPGRDPIVTRILWLRGKESRNANAFGRYIYIHGTPEERTIGTPASYGCIRMRSEDIIDLYSRVGEGTDVVVTTKPLPKPPGGKEAEPPVELLDPMAPQPLDAPPGQAGEVLLAANDSSRKRSLGPPPPTGDAHAERAADPPSTGRSSSRSAKDRSATDRVDSAPSAPPPAPAKERPSDGPAAVQADPAQSAADPAPSKGVAGAWHLTKEKAIRLLMSQNHHETVDTAR